MGFILNSLRAFFGKNRRNHRGFMFIGCLEQEFPVVRGWDSFSGLAICLPSPGGPQGAGWELEITIQQVPQPQRHLHLGLAVCGRLSSADRMLSSIYYMSSPPRCQQQSLDWNFSSHWQINPEDHLMEKTSSQCVSSPHFFTSLKINK